MAEGRRRGEGERAACAPGRRMRARRSRSGELPLIAWGRAQTARRARRRRLRLGGALLSLGAVALMLTLLVPPAPRLVWNASASVPVGLYFVQPGTDVSSGDLALVRLPPGARSLAARRRYLPANVPALKRVAAAAGAQICARGDAILVDGVHAANRLAHDRSGRPLPRWQGCRMLGEGEIFLLSARRSDSFDGRYFGPGSRRDVIGRARLLWAPGAKGTGGE